MSTASSNWLALQKKLPPPIPHSRKRRKLDTAVRLVESPEPPPLPAKTSYAARQLPQTTTTTAATSINAKVEIKNGESLPALRDMIFNKMEYTAAQSLPGKYLSLDCEMVGVGPEGVESSLARVSVVNYYGAVILDAFVKQRERVVDYRTEWSGVRERDMINARPFAEVQALLAELLADRILVGHAVHNDLKVLLLSHPRPQTRDTQVYARKFGVVKSRYISLRELVKQEVGVAIQGGEHSSVTDARATMAVYRLHRREWEKGSAPLKRKRIGAASSIRTEGNEEEEEEADDSADEEEESQESEDAEGARSKTVKLKKTMPMAAKTKQKQKAPQTFPGGGRKGVSSGLSTVIQRHGGRGGAVGTVSRGSRRTGSSGDGDGAGGKWWEQLGSGVTKARA